MTRSSRRSASSVCRANSDGVAQNRWVTLQCIANDGDHFGSLRAGELVGQGGEREERGAGEQEIRRQQAYPGGAKKPHEHFSFVTAWLPTGAPIPRK